MKWFYLIVAGHMPASIYPESKRSFMHDFMKHKKVPLKKLSTMPSTEELLRLFRAVHERLVAFEYPITTVYFDLPGIALMVRPIMDIPIPGLVFQIPAEDVEVVLSDARNRKVNDKYPDLYEIQFFCKSLIIGEAERAIIIEALEKVVPRAVELAALSHP